MLTTETKDYAGESNHWYRPDARPCHQLPYKDKKRKGELRNTTLRDARELGLYPSVSAILGVVEKKGLDGWKKERVATAAHELFRSGVPDNVSLEWWNQGVLEIAEENMTKSRDLGTEIHGAIERYLRGVQGSQEYPEMPYLPASELPYSAHTEAAVAALRELGVWGQPFSAERTFASPLGYGGTVDFQSHELIADFKCVDRLDKKLAYDDRCAQLVAYNRGADFLFADNTDSFWVNNRLSKFKLVNIFISTSEPGKYLIHEWSTEEKEHGWEMFKACFQLWKIVNRYDPLNAL